MLKAMPFALALLASGSAQAAETAVVLKCTLTSGEDSGTMPDSRQTIYKIGNGQWLEWNAERADWTDRCDQVGYVMNGFDGGRTSCQFGDTSFRAVGLVPSDRLRQFMQIDRTTGEIVTGTDAPSAGDPSRAYGTCERTAEPVPPPPPPPPPKPQVKF